VLASEAGKKTLATVRNKGANNQHDTTARSCPLEPVQILRLQKDSVIA
jgi:hypothetical protein